MELRPGYKQTEIGVLPEDWEVDSLGNYVAIQSGESPSRFTFTAHGIPYYKVESLGKTNKFLLFDSTGYHFVSGPTIPERSLFFAKRGAAIALNRIRLSTVPSFMDTNIMALTPKESLDSEYLFYYLSNFSLWELADTTSVPQINNKHIKPLVIPIPPIAEQKAIATALSDVDALLSSLDALIAKKRDMKKAAMQELLTGKTRLPGFSGEWVEKRISDIAEINPESLSSSTPGDYSFKYIALEDVVTGTLVGHSKQIFSNSPSRARRVIQQNDILVATVRPNLKSHLFVTFQEKNWICSTGFCVVRCNDKFALSCFIYYHFFEEVINKQIDLLITGSNYPAINSSDVANLKIFLPTELAEQQAIADILSDMDAEIEALEARYAKVKDMKTGMMQELLTGKTRLVPTGEQHD